MIYRVDNFLDDSFYFTAKSYEVGAYLEDDFLTPTGVNTFNLTIAVSQKKQAFSATIQEKYNLTATLIEKKEKFSATLQEKYSLTVTLVEKKQKFSGSLNEVYDLTIALKQKKEALAAQFQEKYNLTVAIAQKKEKLAASLQLSYILSALLSQKKEAFAAKVNNGEEDMTITLNQKKQGFSAQLVYMPRQPSAAPSLAGWGGQPLLWDIWPKKKLPNPVKVIPPASKRKPDTEREPALVYFDALKRIGTRPRKTYVFKSMDLEPARKAIHAYSRKIRERRDKEAIEV